MAVGGPEGFLIRLSGKLGDCHCVRIGALLHEKVRLLQSEIDAFEMLSNLGTVFVHGVSWSVLPLVAGLFVLVEALDTAGALHFTGAALLWCAQLPRVAGSVAASFGIAGLSNVMNNLPSGLLAGGALQTVSVAPPIRDAILIGVDLGPNLSVTGSLATVLWLIALRREGETVDAWAFFKVGLMVMPPALLFSTIAVSLLSE